MSSAAQASSLAKPGNVDVEVVEKTLTLTRRWYSKSVLFMALCSLPPLIFVVIATMPIVQGEEYNWMSLAIPLPFLLVGLLLAYGALAGFLNSTTLWLDDEQLDVTHGPIPWWIKPVSIESERIKRFLVTQTESKKKHPKYVICAQVSDEEVLSVMNGLPDLETAYFIKEKIQEFLDDSRPKSQE